VRLDVYDSRGRLVRTLVDASLPAGTHAARWDGTNSRGAKVAAGVYFCELRRGGETRSAKLVRVK
jgi:flagellar hook assembly protein FlgD